MSKNNDQIKCYGFAVGNVSMNPLRRYKQKEAFKYIASRKGFLGFSPCYPHGTICIYKTENDAKIAKNQVEAKGIKTGNNIGECWVEKQYLQENK